MPASSLLALIDDVASVLDDVAVLTKVASAKTAGVLGDDLALSAQQVSGIRASRELPVVWAVAKGSLVNKAILLPAALALSAFAPWLVTPLLMMGGAFLCYEGFEKVWCRLVAPGAGEMAHREALARAAGDPAADLASLEKARIRGAIRTDFVLSTEIVVIALGTVAAQPLGVRVAVLVGVALLMTAGVYGLVAAIVKVDDLGLLLLRRPVRGPGGRMLRALGSGLVAASPRLMKALSVAGTAAMLLVGGGILSHGLPFLRRAAEAFQAWVAAAPGVGRALAAAAPAAFGILAGAAAGAILTGAVLTARRLLPSRAAAPR